MAYDFRFNSIKTMHSMESQIALEQVQLSSKQPQYAVSVHHHRVFLPLYIQLK